MDGAINLAIAGTGHMAQTFAAAMARVSGLSLAGFLSRDPARAQALSAQFAAPTHYARLEDLLADPTVDALYLGNGNAAHTAMCIAALEAGKAVLCEKPCGLTGAHARAIRQAAQQSGTLFMEAIPTPFLPAIKRLIEAATTGELGTLRHLSASFGYPATPEAFPGCFASDGGVLLDRGIYPVTLALLLMGPVRHVEARIIRNADGVDVEAWLLLDHDGGAVSSLGASLVSELDNRLCLAGTNGSAMIEAPLLKAERLRIHIHGEPERAEPALGDLVTRLKQMAALRRLAALSRAARAPHLSYGDSPYRGEIEHFRDLLRAGATASPLLPPDISVAAHELLDRIRASAP